MIVWLASYPRSGNTFCRILLHTQHGLPTYTGFRSGDDLELDRTPGNLTGHAPLPDSLRAASTPSETEAALQALHHEPRTYFIKTHCAPIELFHSPFPALVLVRDPRAAILSLSHYLIDVQLTLRRLAIMLSNKPSQILHPRTAAFFAKEAITRAGLAFARPLGLRPIIQERTLAKLARQARWSEVNRGWLERPGAKTTVVRFEDLVLHPLAEMQRAVADLGLSLPAPKAGAFPSFDELKAMHPTFFRSGKTDGWKTELSPAIRAIIEDGHRPMMRRLGY